MVRTDQKGHGIGYALMTALLAEARRRGFEAVVGYILQENRVMLQMIGELGFKVERIVGGVAEVRVDLARAA
jgi:acetyltransferase